VAAYLGHRESAAGGRDITPAPSEVVRLDDRH